MDCRQKILRVQRPSQSSKIYSKLYNIVHVDVKNKEEFTKATSEEAEQNERSSSRISKNLTS